VSEKPKEECVACGEFTGRAGAGEDSIYCDPCDRGPLCEGCGYQHYGHEDKPTPAVGVSEEEIDGLWNEECINSRTTFRREVRRLIALAEKRQRERSAKFMRCFHDDSTLEQHMICGDCRDAILGGGDE